MPELKTAATAAVQIDRNPPPEPWQVDRDRQAAELEEHHQAEALAKAENIPFNEAQRTLRSRQNAASILPGQSAKLREREGKAALELEKVEAERERLEGIASQWTSLQAEREGLTRQIQKCADHIAALSEMVENAAATGVEVAIGSEWGTPMVVQQFAGLCGADRALTAFRTALEAKRSALTKLSETMAAFAKTNNIQTV